MSFYNCPDKAHLHKICSDCFYKTLEAPLLNKIVSLIKNNISAVGGVQNLANADMGEDDQEQALPIQVVIQPGEILLDDGDDANAVPANEVPADEEEDEGQ